MPVWIDWWECVALREPLRYESAPREAARAKQASSHSRSRSSNDCIHHLSKSIRRVHGNSVLCANRWFVFPFPSLYVRYVCAVYVFSYEVSNRERFENRPTMDKRRVRFSFRIERKASVNRSIKEIVHGNNRKNNDRTSCLDTLWVFNTLFPNASVRDFCVLTVLYVYN